MVNLDGWRWRWIIKAGDLTVRTLIVLHRTWHACILCESTSWRVFHCWHLVGRLLTVEEELSSVALVADEPGWENCHWLCFKLLVMKRALQLISIPQWFLILTHKEARLWKPVYPVNTFTYHCSLNIKSCIDCDKWVSKSICFEYPLSLTVLTVILIRKQDGIASPL